MSEQQPVRYSLPARDSNWAESAASLLEHPGALNLRRSLQPTDIEGATITLETVLHEGGQALARWR